MTTAAPMVWICGRAQWTPVVRSRHSERFFCGVARNSIIYCAEVAPDFAAAAFDLGCIQFEDGIRMELGPLDDADGRPNTWLDYQYLVEAAVAPYRVRAEQAGIRLRVAAMPEVTLLVDRLQMEVVLRSLLANAFESVADSPRQPRRVWVAAWKEGTELACLRVEDSGQGLSPERVNHLFEPQEAISDGGRGFGLAISRAIVATHGGRLWGEVANHGIFKIELPIIGSDGLPPPTEPVFSESDI